MLSKNDITRLYEMVLAVPGMNEVVKVDLRLPRKNILLLSKIIERGTGMEDGEGKEATILDSVPAETMEELKEVAFDLLQKSGLSEMNEKLKAL